MFTPRGVTKRLRAAVTGYYVLGTTVIIIIIIINRPSTVCRGVIIKIRLFEIWYRQLIVAVRCNANNKRYTAISFYLSSRPLHRCAGAAGRTLTGPPPTTRRTRSRNPRDPTALYQLYFVRLVSKKIIVETAAAETSIGWARRAAVFTSSSCDFSHIILQYYIVLTPSSTIVYFVLLILTHCFYFSGKDTVCWCILLL